MLTILQGDAKEQLALLHAGSVQTCVTSPPYFGLRDYGTAKWEGGDSSCEHKKSELRRGVHLAHSSASTRGGAKKVAEAGWIPYSSICGKCGALRIDRQIGLEDTPEAYVEKLVEVFREVRRVLSDDGTCWINLGDSYAQDTKWGGTTGGKHAKGLHGTTGIGRNRHKTGLPGKNLVGVPWRVAFALQADGWILRSDIVWHKLNPMPEPVTDRPTKSHEYIFLLSKSARYFYDADAIREPLAPKTFTTFGTEHRAQGNDGLGKVKSDNWGRTVPTRQPKMNGDTIAGANKRSVWSVASRPYADAHFATFPPALILPCILAGSRAGDAVLDPFAGSGTTGQVAIENGRKAILIELNPAYIKLIEKRCQTTIGFGF